MIKRPTVLILGAGASVDYGFPTGRKLLLDICRNTNKDKSLFQFLNQTMRFEAERIRQFQEALLNSQAPSVDLFLENRREFEELGKTAMAASLIPYESFEAFNREKPDGWYEFLFWRMIEGGRFEDNPLSVITFNYDRSLEAFFWFALCHLRGLHPETALATIQKIRVLHVHGDLSECLWKPGVKPGYSYGLASGRPDLAPEWIREAATRIRIIYEDEDLDKGGQAVDMLTGAEEVIFLGFGFHEGNVRRLRFGKVQERKQHTNVGRFRCLASRYGMGDGDIERAKNLFGSIYPPLFGKEPNASIMDFLKNTPCLM